MKKILLTLLIILITNCVYGETKYSGNSVVCHNIDYLSTSCLNVDVLPLEFVDKEIAIEKARQPIHEENTNVNINLNEDTVNILKKEIKKQREIKKEEKAFYKENLEDGIKIISWIEK